MINFFKWLWKVLYDTVVGVLGWSFCYSLFCLQSSKGTQLWQNGSEASWQYLLFLCASLTLLSRFCLYAGVHLFWRAQIRNLRLCITSLGKAWGSCTALLKGWNSVISYLTAFSFLFLHWSIVGSIANIWELDCNQWVLVIGGQGRNGIWSAITVEMWSLYPHIRTCDHKNLYGFLCCTFRFFV